MNLYNFNKCIEDNKYNQFIDKLIVYKDMDNVFNDLYAFELFKNIINNYGYFKDKNITPKIINEYNLFDTDITNDRYFTNRNYKKIMSDRLYMKIYILYHGKNKLITDIIKYSDNINNYILLMSIFNTKGDYYSINYMLDYIYDNYDRLNFINEKGNKISKFNIPYKIASEIINLYNINYSYESKIKFVDNILIKHKLFKLLNNGHYFKLYNRMPYNDINEYEKKFNISFCPLYYLRLLKSNSINLFSKKYENEKIEYLKRLKKEKDIDISIIKSFSILFGKYYDMYSYYEFIKKNNLINDKIVNTIYFNFFSEYVHFYDDKELQYEFIEYGLDISKIKKVNQDHFINKYYLTNRAVTNATKRINIWYKYVCNYIRLSKIKTLLIF